MGSRESDVLVTGRGTAVVLLHGWPHTPYLWHRIIPALSTDHLVIAPDLRSLSSGDGGADAETLTSGLIHLLDSLDITHAAVVAIDAGVPTAFLAALQHPDRVSRLVLMEGVLPGVETKFSPPWWFGFHAVPGLAESVLLGHEAEYLDWFLSGPSVRQDIGTDARENFVAAHTGHEALKAGFEYYRAMQTTATQIQKSPAVSKLTVPTLAISGGVVGDAIHQQLVPYADNLTHTSIPHCGHLIPLEQPAALTTAITPFLATPPEAAPPRQHLPS